MEDKIDKREIAEKKNEEKGKNRGGEREAEIQRKKS